MPLIHHIDQLCYKVLLLSLATPLSSCFISTFFLVLLLYFKSQLQLLSSSKPCVPNLRLYFSGCVLNGWLESCKVGIVVLMVNNFHKDCKAGHLLDIEKIQFYKEKVWLEKIGAGKIEAGISVCKKVLAEKKILAEKVWMTM